MAKQKLWRWDQYNEWKERQQKEKTEPVRKERAGVCSNCHGTKFRLSIKNHRLIRHCKTCGMAIDPDTGETIEQRKEVNENDGE